MPDPSSTTLRVTDRSPSLLTPLAWLGILSVGLAFASMHWEILRRSVSFSKDPNWSHILIVPLIAIYYVVQHKGRLDAAPKRVCWGALPLVLVGLYTYLFWMYPGQSNMFRGWSAVFTLGMVLWFILGTSAMRVLWFPVAYLVFGVKISDSVWSRIAESLQDIAAAGATVCLESLAVFMDFTVTSTGNSIELGFMRGGQWVREGLNVAEACSGLRMLMAFVALGVALAFLFPRPWWQRVMMMAATVPVAVAVNIGRVTALGIIYTYDKKYAQGDFHVFIGLLMLIPAAGMFLLLGWVMDRVVVRDEAAAAPDVRPALTAGPSTAAIGPAGLLRGVALGAALALVTGATYAMLFNTFSRNQLFEGLSPAMSGGLMALGLGCVIGLLILIPRAAPAAGAVFFAAAVATGVLGVSAIGQQTALTWQKAVLFKKEVPPRHSLARIPLRVGSYQFVQDLPISSDEIDELGTEEFISRIYMNEDVEGAGRLIRLHVTYYTGMVDTVPHVPDRCFVANGVAAAELVDQTLSLDPGVFVPQPDGRAAATSRLRAPATRADADPRGVYLPGTEVATKRFSYADNPTAKPSHVIYFFSANGKFMASPHAVRANGVNIRDEYSYYAKIEVGLVGVHDVDAAVAGTERFLDAFLPDILACLPDWDDVGAGAWPVDESGSDRQ